MYKLTVVAGPNRGTSYAVQDGETSIGRQAGNVIVLSSARVSKKHCSLKVVGGEVLVQDEGSSNGTFVNGILTRARKLKAGDRISVGEFTLELVQPAARIAAPMPVAPGFGNVVQFPGAAPAGAALAAGGGEGQAADAMPQDLKGKALWFFDHKVMPFFYGQLLKHEWRMIGVAAIAAIVLGNLFISVSPLMESGRQSVIREVSRRAQFMARELVERNTPAIAAKAETKTEIGAIETENGVKLALLMDLDDRIIAPAARMNQTLSSGDEARYAVRARDAYRKGRETGMVSEVNSGTVVAIEPIKVLSPQAGKNVVVGMALVSLDSSLSTPDLGEMGVVYSETLILTALLGGLLLLILYRLTLRPFQVLNDDIDKVLKGDLTQVTHEFKLEELNSLWDNINSALARVPRGEEAGGGGFDGALGGAMGNPIDEFAGPLRMLGGIAKFGLVICDGDRRIAYINPVFEEISGIRNDNSIGQDIPSVARDQAFGSFSNDLFDRALPGSEGASEDFDFSGIGYRMYACAFGNPGSAAKCYALVAVRSE